MNFKNSPFIIGYILMKNSDFGAISHWYPHINLEREFISFEKKIVHNLLFYDYVLSQFTLLFSPGGTMVHQKEKLVKRFDPYNLSLKIA